MRSSHLSLLTAALLVAAANHVGAQQLPGPAELPWNSPPRSVRFALHRLGLRESAATAAGADSTLVFTAAMPGANARLTTRFRAGHLWHALLTVQGDSAALQQVLNGYAAAVSARHGQPQAGEPRSRWVLRDGRAFTLPRAPTRLENGTFGFAVSFHGR